jgi:membrane dipeptidase
VTHANSKVVHNHVRNLDDEYLENLKAKRGVVGFVFAGGMIGGKRNLDELVRHIMYVYEKFGSNNIAIGSDFFGLGSRAPPGLEDITKVKGIWEALLDKGMRESDIEKLSCRNALRVIEANASRWKPYA